MGAAFLARDRKHLHLLGGSGQLNHHRALVAANLPVSGAADNECHRALAVFVDAVANVRLRQTLAAGWVHAHATGHGLLAEILEGRVVVAPGTERR